MSNKKIYYCDAGPANYREMWDLQEQLLQRTVRTKTENRSKEFSNQAPTSNYFLMCEHPHIYTLGKSGHEEYLLANEQKLKEIDAEFVKINRGGDITYHGPGQIVGYPILDLENFFTDIHKYLRFLEEAIIKMLADYGIEGGRYEGFTGVWIDADKPTARKICAMGVRCSRWVTMHGFAFNANVDLDYFSHIIPCGITDKAVTSLNKELGRTVDEAEVKEKILKYFAAVFECEFSPIAYDQLQQAVLQQ